MTQVKGIYKEIRHMEMEHEKEVAQVAERLDKHIQENLDYLKRDRKVSCLGLPAIERHLEEHRESKEGSMKKTHLRIILVGIILASLFSVITAVITLLP